MNSLEEKLVRIIKGYDPNKLDMLCKIDIIKLSQLEALHNPSENIKGAVEAFLDYASAAIEKHPRAHLNDSIEKMFGEALNKMADIAPEAYQKYQASQEVKPNTYTSQSRGGFVAAL